MPVKCYSSGILEKANQLEEQEPQFETVTRQLSHLAQNFLIRQLQQFLQQYRDYHRESHLDNAQNSASD